MNQYYLKDGYIENKVNRTIDSISGNNYWNQKRLRTARYCQAGVYNTAKKIVLEKNIASVIDLGCGPAIKLADIYKTYPKISFAGVDQASAIEYCKSNHSFGNWFDGDFDQLDDTLLSKLLERPSPKLIICSDVIEHLHDPDVILTFIKKIAKKSDIILLSTPERDSLRGRDAVTSGNIHHIREWNFSEFSKYISSNNFLIHQHFLQLPVSLSLNRLSLREIYWRLISFRPIMTNQVMICSINNII